MSFSSTAIKRVCRATLQAQTYALQNAREAGDRVRALLADLYGYGIASPDWYDASRRAIPHVMLSDCRSLVANLNTEVPPGSRQEAANRARRHTPIDIRWRRQAYGRGLPQGRRPRRLGSERDASSRLPHKEHEADLHAQSSGYMQVPDLARRVFQAQRKS